MKILHINVGLSLMGGAESIIIGLANEMAETNDVTVCSIFKPVDGGVYYTRLNSSVKRCHLGITECDSFLRSIWRVFKYIGKTNAQIVHIHGFFHYYIFPILLFHKRIKFVYTLHSDAYMENTIWEKKIIWLKRFCFKHGWLNAVTISPQSRDSFYKLYNLESTLILNGVKQRPICKERNDIDKERKDENTRVFFHPGRISEPKNQVILCKVFQKLIQEGEDVVLLIAGTKQDLSIFSKIEPMFCDRIKYLGERNDVPELLSRADGLCLPSIWEGLPVVLLEALSVGCIPICSPVGGIISVVSHGKNGILSESSNENDYYNAIKYYLSLMHDEILKMKNECLESFKPYSINASVDRYIGLYNKLIK